MRRFCDCISCRRLEEQQKAWHGGRFFRKRHRVFYPAPSERSELKAKRQAVYRDLRAAIYVRDAFCCRYCLSDSGGRLTLDHIVPVSRGGTNAPSNLVTCCKKCNLAKGDGPIDSPRFIAHLKARRLEKAYARRVRIKYYYYALLCTPILERAWSSTSASRAAGSTSGLTARIARAFRSFFSR